MHHPKVIEARDVLWTVGVMGVLCPVYLAQASMALAFGTLILAAVAIRMCGNELRRLEALYGED